MTCSAPGITAGASSRDGGAQAAQSSRQLDMEEHRAAQAHAAQHIGQRVGRAIGGTVERAVERAV